MPQRKNAFKLTKEEQETYKKAITTMIADGSYFALVRIHSEMQHRMHTMAVTGRIGTMRFLPWHRAYLVHMEAELVKKEPKAFIPYLRWLDGGIPPWLDSFKPTVNGVVNSRALDGPPPLSTAARYALLLSKTDFFDFSYNLELDPHNIVHGRLGSPMQFVPIAPSDPIFWMHHGEVDRVWAEWQTRQPGKGPVLTQGDAVMDPWKDTVDSLTSISKLGYSYV